jgi:hypothetical protein
MLPSQVPNANVQRPPALLQQAAALPQVRDSNPASLQQNSVMLPSQVPSANVQRPPALLQQAAALPQIRNTAAANVPQNATLPPQIPAAGASTPALPAPPPLPGATRGNESLLALSPVPATPDEIVRIPAGEARGRFAVSPQPNLAGDENEPPGRGTSGSRGSSNATSATPGDGTSGGKDGSGNAPSNTSAPNGTGPAGASGRNEFPGVTILGAGSIVENGRVTRGPTSSPAPISTSYGLTVLSTGASGGGLPQFGVFASSDQIHTVFLDMRRSMFDASPSWTFQYALLNPPSETAPVRPNQQGLVLPFPTTKDFPALPDNLVRRNLNKMVIVYGIVNTRGRFESLDVKQSPDSLLDGPIVAALSKWIFKPAEFNGESVPVKVLLGIPVSLP